MLTLALMLTLTLALALALTQAELAKRYLAYISPTSPQAELAKLRREVQAQAKQAGPQADPRLKELDGRLTKL